LLALPLAELAVAPALPPSGASVNSASPSLHAAAAMAPTKNRAKILVLTKGGS
jgi:hypothetical protein